MTRPKLRPEGTKDLKGGASDGHRQDAAEVQSEFFEGESMQAYAANVYSSVTEESGRHRHSPETERPAVDSDGVEVEVGSGVWIKQDSYSGPRSRSRVAVAEHLAASAICCYLSPLSFSRSSRRRVCASSLSSSAPFFSSAARPALPSVALAGFHAHLISRVDSDLKDSPQRDKTGSWGKGPSG
ncbi:unnamed protein product [Boreogadus saida]